MASHRSHLLVVLAKAAHFVTKDRAQLLWTENSGRRQRWRRFPGRQAPHQLQQLVRERLERRRWFEVLEGGQGWY